jgi:hypothetical protein
VDVHFSSAPRESHASPMSTVFYSLPTQDHEIIVMFNTGSCVVPKYGQWPLQSSYQTIGWVIHSVGQGIRSSFSSWPRDNMHIERMHFEQRLVIAKT